MRFLDRSADDAEQKDDRRAEFGMKLAALDVLATSGKVDSDRFKTTLIAMLKTDDAKSRQTVLNTIAETRLTSAVPTLLEQLATPSDDAARLPLVRMLGELGEKSAFEPVEGVADRPDPMHAHGSLAGV